MRELIADGGCLCGAVRYSINGEMHWAGYCHCESCRKQTASPLTAYVSIDESAVMFHGETVSTFQSSEGVERGFCGKCGTPVSYKTTERPGEIELYLASLDVPQAVLPQSHVHWGERLPWLEIHDDLEKYQRGEIDENEPET